MRIIFKNKLLGLFLLTSPLMLIVLLFVSALLGYDSITGVVMTIVEIYSIIFFLFSSYIHQYGKTRETKSKYEVILLNGFSIGGPILFAWLFLLPFMKDQLGMWDNQFLNLMVTLSFSYFIFFCLVGVQSLLSSTFTKKSNFFSLN